METVRAFFKPYLKRQFILLAMVVILAITALMIWLTQPEDIPLIESRRQEVLCTLWRNKVAIQLASLRTKYITDRDAYLLQGFQRLESDIESQLPNCVNLLRGYQAKPFDRTLEDLVVQLTQKEDLALSTIIELESIFVSH
jgi:hypothetical protein